VGRDAAEKEFGKGIIPPVSGWKSLSKPLEIAISTSPLILFKSKKLSSVTIARWKLTIVSYNINQIFQSNSLQIGTALGYKGKKQECLYLATGKDDLEFLDQYCFRFNFSGSRNNVYDSWDEGPWA